LGKEAGKQKFNEAEVKTKNRLNFDKESKLC